MPFMAPSLSIAPFKDVYRREMLGFLDSRDGPKAIYWERETIAPINLIVGHSVLKEHGVCHSYIIDPKNMAQSPPDVNTIFFVIHSELKIVDLIRNFLRIEPAAKSESKKEYCIIAIPSFSLVCKTFLQEMQVYDKLAAIFELPLSLLPLDSDLLSMEEPNCFAEFALHEKEGSLFNMAKGLMKFQSVFGLFPRIRAKGAKAKRVASMLVQMRQEANASVSSDSSPNTKLLDLPGQTDLLIIIDRSVDILTPCLSQFTYEGLINEVWPVNYGSSNITLTGSTSPKRILFNSTDQLFTEIRDVSFANVGAVLGKRTKELSAIINETKTSKELTTLRRVVGQLPELRQLHTSASLHMNLAEQLQEYVNSDDFTATFRTLQDFLAGNESDKAHPYVEQRILELAPIEEVLRLICVQSFCNGGLKQRLIDFYKREILQMYGSEHMMTLDNLERLGLLEESSRLANFINPGHVDNAIGFLSNGIGSVKRTVAAVSMSYNATLRRSLRLQPTIQQLQQQEDQSLDACLGRISPAGSIPISVRLVQAMALGWPTALATTSRVYTATSVANSALQAGRRLVSGLPQSSSSSHLNCSSSSGGYVTSLLSAVEVDEIQTITTSSEFSSSDGRKLAGANSESGKTVVVAFVGGVTHSEIAALRRVAAADEGRVDFIFVTTGLLTWKSFFRSLAEPINVTELTS